MRNTEVMKTGGLLFNLVLIIAISSLSYFIYLQNARIEVLEERNISQKKENRDSDSIIQEVTSEEGITKSEVAALVSQILAEITPAPTITAKITTQSQPTLKVTKTAYIPLGTTFTTTATDWVDVVDSGVYIDLEKEYGTSATVSWEIYLKVAHGNGQAFARLYDDTNKIAVDFSELLTTNNVASTLVSSKNLPFWKGRNLYKIQIKSLNSFEVTGSGAKIKVQY